MHLCISVSIYIRSLDQLFQNYVFTTVSKVTLTCLLLHLLSICNYGFAWRRSHFKEHTSLNGVFLLANNNHLASVLSSDIHQDFLLDGYGRHLSSREPPNINKASLLSACCSRTIGILFQFLKKVSKYDQEIPQSHIADQPVASWGKAK